ncbi:MAG: hypothetical protein ABIP39_01270, partial [Polyangiaceae bacterium]
IPDLGGLEPVILKSLEKTPANRYATMDALARDLERVAKKRESGVSLAPAKPATDDDVGPFTVKEKIGARPALPVWARPAMGVAAVAVVVFVVTRVVYQPLRAEVRPLAPTIAVAAPSVAPVVPTVSVAIVLPPPALEPAASVQAPAPTPAKIRPLPKAAPPPPPAPKAPTSEFRDPWSGK